MPGSPKPLPHSRRETGSVLGGASVEGEEIASGALQIGFGVTHCHPFEAFKGVC
jgi:hypothetical protein